MLFLLASASLSQAATYFDSDFEGCAASPGNDWPCDNWDDAGTEAICTANRLQVMNTGGAYSGSKYVRLTYDNAFSSTCKPSIYKTITATSHVFFRAAMRQSVGFQTSSQNNASKRVRFRPANTGDPNPSDGLGAYPIFWLYNHYGSYSINIEQPCDKLAGQYWINANPPTPGGWDEVEFEVFMNTPGQSNGGLRIWVNGVLRAQSLNRKWVADTPTGVCGSSNIWHPSNWFTTEVQIYLQSGVGTVDYDRVAVGNTRIGAVGGTPPPLDTTPPTPPTNVTVQ